MADPTPQPTPIQDAFTAVHNFLAQPVFQSLQLLRDRLAQAKDTEAFINSATQALADRKAAMEADLAAYAPQYAQQKAALDLQLRTVQSSTQAEIDRLNAQLSTTQQTFAAKRQALDDTHAQIMASYKADQAAALVALTQTKDALAQARLELQDAKDGLQAAEVKRQELLDALHASTHP